MSHPGKERGGWCQHMEPMAPSSMGEGWPLRREVELLWRMAEGLSEGPEG